MKKKRVDFVIQTNSRVFSVERSYNQSGSPEEENSDPEQRKEFKGKIGEGEDAQEKTGNEEISVTRAVQMSMRK